MSGSHEDGEGGRFVGSVGEATGSHDGGLGRSVAGGVYDSKRPGAQKHPKEGVWLRGKIKKNIEN